MCHAADRRCSRSTAGIGRQPSSRRSQICSTDHEAEKQDQRGILGGQGALDFHAAAKLLVQALPRSERGSERNDVTLTIRDDGSFDVVSKKILGASRGKGHIVISDGHLVFEGERGLRGLGTVLRNPAGDVS
jgi:hypothetical protein